GCGPGRGARAHRDRQPGGGGGERARSRLRAGDARSVSRPPLVERGGGRARASPGGRGRPAPHREGRGALADRRPAGARARAPRPLGVGGRRRAGGSPRVGTGAMKGSTRGSTRGSAQGSTPASTRGSRRGRDADVVILGSGIGGLVLALK